MSSNNEEDPSSHLLVMGGNNELTFGLADLDGFELTAEEFDNAINAPSNIFEDQVVQYFAGYAYKKLLKIHTTATECDTCSVYGKKFTANEREFEQNKIFIWLKRYNDEESSLFDTTPEFSSYVKSIVLVTDYCFKKYPSSPKFIQSIVSTIVKKVSSPSFCNNIVRDKVVTYLVRTLTFYNIKWLNDELRDIKKTSRPSKSKLKKIRHE